jgi:septum formation protein
MYKVILASGSPRRKEILEQVGVSFEIITSNIEEVTTKEKPEEIVVELAEMKAKDIANKMNENVIVIGADTMVAMNGQVMGKPKSEADAKNMISMLQGNKHQVYTGVSVIIKKNDKERSLTFVEKSDVWINPMTEGQIDAYLNTDEPYDKAGAYAIQGIFALNIGGIEGDYNNIVGFPIARLYQVLLKEGIDIIHP